jgi:hypothetical protein
MRALRDDCYWWANIYKNFKLTLNLVRLTSSQYNQEIHGFLDKFEERFLYRRILNEDELEEIHRYTDNVVLKYSDAMVNVDRDVC